MRILAAFGVRFDLRRLIVVGGWVLASCCAPAAAIPTRFSADQLQHTQWTPAQGAPAEIEHVTQTSDGFLWIASPTGLFRFDGVRFEPVTGAGGVSLLPDQPFTLLPSRDGGLWIGYSAGAVSHLRQGRLINYPLPPELPLASALTLAEAPDGVLWVGTSQGLRRLHNGVWDQPRADWNPPVGPVLTLTFDREGVLWVSGFSLLRFLRPGARSFEQLPIDGAAVSTTLTKNARGEVVLCAHEHFGTLTLKASPAGAWRVLDWNTRQGLISRQSQCLLDRDGHLWVAGPHGAGRFKPGAANRLSAAKDPFTDVVPLSGKFLTALLEDREGSLWFATRGGLDRLRAPPFSRELVDAGALMYFLVASPSQGTWAASTDGDIYHYHDDRRDKIPSAALNTVGVDAVYVAPDGSFWAGGGNALWHLLPDRTWRKSSRLPTAAVSVGGTSPTIRAMTQDATGAMWVSVRGLGLYRVVGEVWTPAGGRTDLPLSQVVSMFTDSRHRIWFGCGDGTLAVLDGDQVRFLSSRSPRTTSGDLGAIWVITEWNDRMLLGTDSGLWWIEGEQLHRVHGGNGGLGVVNGIAPAPNGDLWLSTIKGVAHMTAEAFRTALKRPEIPVSVDLMTHLDGLPAVPRGASISDGRLWITTYNGLAWLDVSTITRNRIAPAVVVTSLVGDGRTFAVDTGQPITLPSRTRSLQIAYTASSLAIPERVKFRYRLTGNDGDWQDVGTRREAFFTDLPPGSYGFQVIASNNDGVWNETGADIRFEIPPTFTQSLAFKLLCGLLGIAAVWLLVVVRLRAAKARWRLRAEARMAERERIARELHDTLLQSTQGLMIQVQAAINELPAQDPVRAALDATLDRGEVVLTEGRDRVLDLRVGSEDAGELSESLAAAAREISNGSGDGGDVQFRSTVQGQPRALQPGAREEIYRIGREALLNAFRHAQARHIDLQLVFDATGLQLLVRDDGVGVDPRWLQAGKPSDHWGLRGIRERASRIGATLSVRNRPEGGTEIELVVPAARCYAREAVKRGWFPRRSQPQ